MNWTSPLFYHYNVYKIQLQGPVCQYNFFFYFCIKKYCGYDTYSRVIKYKLLQQSNLSNMWRTKRQSMRIIRRIRKTIWKLTREFALKLFFQGHPERKFFIFLYTILQISLTVLVDSWVICVTEHSCMCPSLLSLLLSRWIVTQRLRT